MVKVGRVTKPKVSGFYVKLTNKFEVLSEGDKQTNQFDLLHDECSLTEIIKKGEDVNFCSSFTIWTRSIFSLRNKSQTESGPTVSLKSCGEESIKNRKRLKDSQDCFENEKKFDL